MTQTICDFCGRVLGKSIRLIPTSMEKLSISRYGIRADICEECYRSFNEWVASRKEAGQMVTEERSEDVDEYTTGNE